MTLSRCGIPGVFASLHLAVLLQVLRGVCLVQDISTAEGEAAKKKVGSAAAMKQLEKLRKEAAKTSKDAERTADELASKKEENKVADWALLSFLRADNTTMDPVSAPAPAY